MVHKVPQLRVLDFQRIKQKVLSDVNSALGYHLITYGSGTMLCPGLFGTKEVKYLIFLCFETLNASKK